MRRSSLSLVLRQHFERWQALGLRRRWSILAILRETCGCGFRISGSMVTSSNPFRATQPNVTAERFSHATGAKAAGQRNLRKRTDPLGFLAEPPCVINCANGEIWIADDGDCRPAMPIVRNRTCMTVSTYPTIPRPSARNMTRHSSEYFAKTRNQAICAGTGTSFLVT